MATENLVAGTTIDIVYQLLIDDEVPGTSLAGTVELILTEKITGAVLETSGDASISDASTWKVKYSPDSADLVKGIYYAHWKVTDGGGKISFFPDGPGDIWYVWAA